MHSIGIWGLGMVGHAIETFLNQSTGYTVHTYDKYKPSGPVEALYTCEVLFLCLPTLYNGTTYDMSAVNDTLALLHGYTGLILLKSTVDPSYCRRSAETYPDLNLVHNPEFLTARTAAEDFESQRHIVLGSTSIDIPAMARARAFYAVLFPHAEISSVVYEAAALTKLACNAFYATKVQFFTEIYLLCNKLGLDYQTVRQLMLNNKWIHPQHTQVPGPDGQVSFGGACLPKDTQALHAFMAEMAVPCDVLNAVIKENLKTRPLN